MSNLHRKKVNAEDFADDFFLDEIESDGDSMFDFSTIVSVFMQNIKWFVLSVVVCLGLAAVKLYYSPKVYLATTKVLVKEEESNTRRSAKSALMNIENIGMLSNSTGIDNEVEIIGSPTTVEDVVRKMNLNVDYYLKGRLKSNVMYKNQPVNAAITMSVNDEDFYPIKIKLQKNGSNYRADVEYKFLKVNTQTLEIIDTTFVFKKLPFHFNTKQGEVMLTENTLPHVKLDNKTLTITISSYASTAVAYAKAITVEPSSKKTTIADISFTDEHPRRIVDFLTQLVQSYNSLANEDKNEIAIRTEEFINSRLEKIDSELGDTESRLESYKRNNNVFELRQKTQAALTQQSQYEIKLNEAATQVEILRGLREYIDNPANKYEAMPFNIGVQDQATTTLIARYNEAVLARKRLLVTSSNANPSVIALTQEIDGLAASLRQAIFHAQNNAETVYRNERTNFSKYASQLSLTPSQERVLTQIGRQQEVRAELYLLLLQKREENSISLAATADKGKMIYKPQISGTVSPRKGIILAIALFLSLVIPFGIFFIMMLLRNKIEELEDVKKLSSLPVVASLAVVNDTAKTKGEIVVHENSNNYTEEMFRQLRTNLMFTMKENDKVILFTSSIPGEGKTFVASNLAVSFALYGKRVLLVGLDIRKPRLSTLFELNDEVHGISTLLTKENPTIDDIRKQIVPSGVHDSLDLLMAGPIPPNPAELLGRKSLDKIIETVKEEYDYIILDTAPVTLVTDTMLIGRVADASIYVCRLNHTPKYCFQELNEIARDEKLPNVSLAINGLEVTKKRYGKYGSYGRYGHYGNYMQYGYGNEHDKSVTKK